MRVGFIGRGRLGYRVLSALLDSGNEIVFAVTCSDTPDVGEARTHIENIAKIAGIRYSHIPTLRGTLARSFISAASPDLIVAIQWRHTLDEEITSIPKIGILNVHGGLLPEFRGNACQSWAILSGSSQVGLTAHLMQPGRLDSGPILRQTSLSIEESETVGDIRQRLDTEAVSMVISCVQLLTNEPEFRGSPQDETNASYCYPRLPLDGEIDWDLPAIEVSRLIRAASHPYPGAYSWFTREGVLCKLVIFRAEVQPPPYPSVYVVPGHVIHLPGGRIGVATGDARLIVPLEAEVDGLRLDSKMHFSGVRNRLGLDVGNWVRHLDRRVRDLESRVDSLLSR